MTLDQEYPVVPALNALYLEMTSRGFMVHPTLDDARRDLETTGSTLVQACPVAKFKLGTLEWWEVQEIILLHRWHPTSPSVSIHNHSAENAEFVTAINAALEN